jgi:hypothetical protein
VAVERQLKPQLRLESQWRSGIIACGLFRPPPTVLEAIYHSELLKCKERENILEQTLETALEKATPMKVRVVKCFVIAGG